MNVHNPEGSLQGQGGVKTNPDIKINPRSGLITEDDAAFKEQETWFSERFTALPSYGKLDIMSPSALLGLLINVDDAVLPDLNIGQSAHKAGLRHIAELVPNYLGEAFPRAWSSLYDRDLPSVSEGIAKALAYIAMIGVLAEATWRTQEMQMSGHYKPSETYAKQIQQILYDVIAANADAGPYSEGLTAALDVGAAVIAEFAVNAKESLGEGGMAAEKDGSGADNQHGPVPVPYQV